MLPRSPVHEVVEADDLVATVEQGVAEVGAEEAGAAGDDDSRPSGQRPMPSYSKPCWRRRVRSSRLRVSTMRAGRHLRRHLVEVEPLELVPLGEHDEHLGARARGVRVARPTRDAGDVRVDGRVVGGDIGAAAWRRWMISMRGRLARCRRCGP